MQAILFEIPLEQALSEVLESMCFLFIEEDNGTRNDEPELVVTRCLEFRGPFSGSFGIEIPFAIASLITCNLIGQEPEEITPELVAESIGEIANMVCGAVLCRVESRQKFDLTTPHSQADGISNSMSVNRICRTFQIEGAHLKAWMEIEHTS